MTLPFVFIVVVALFTAIAAVVDVRQHRIPNYLTVPVALLGFLFHAVTQGSAGLLIAGAGFAVGFGLLLVPWLIGGGGMGDVKLLAALGAWLGPMMLLITFALSALLGAALAAGLMFYQAGETGFWKTKAYATVRSDGRKGPTIRRARALPFAVPVAVGTWAILGWMIVSYLS